MRCLYCLEANVPDCGNQYQHWEKKRLIQALLDCHDKIRRLEQRVRHLEGEKYETR